jgi:hypothetical protein
MSSKFLKITHLFHENVASEALAAFTLSNNSLKVPLVRPAQANDSCDEESWKNDILTPVVSEPR